jgi:trimeric autotransporter adhesin
VGELPRVLLVGVPYALKAADADTLAGRPASAYALVEGQSAVQAETATLLAASSNAQELARKGNQTEQVKSAVTPCSGVTSDGTATANQIAMFTSPCNVENSVLSQSGSNIGVGTSTPAATLDVNGNFNLPATTSTTVGVIDLGNNPFIHACCPNSAGNTFLGNAGISPPTRPRPTEGTDGTLA